MLLKAQVIHTLRERQGGGLWIHIKYKSGNKAQHKTHSSHKPLEDPNSCTMEKRTE